MEPSKTCFKCLACLPLESFYKHSRMKDGRLNKCIECTKRDVNRHRQENLDRLRAYDRLRGGIPHRVAARKEYSQTPEGKAAHARALKVQRKRFPERDKARRDLHNAVRDKKVARLPCQICGNPKSEGHHPHYDNPLSVVWLCNKHHVEAHELTKELRA